MKTDVFPMIYNQKLILLQQEKIEDAKSENDKKKKYQLMRIESTLQKEITRIKYGLRYY